jgi:hypothetical protein
MNLLQGKATYVDNVACMLNLLAKNNQLDRTVFRIFEQNAKQ